MIVSRSRFVRNGHVDRLDAEFFVAEVEGLAGGLPKADGVSLGSLAEIADKRGGDPKGWENAETASFPYLEISNIDIRDGFALASETPCVEASPRARMKLETGMVCLSSVRPVRNAVVLVPPDLDGAVGSTGFVNLIPKKVSSELLFALSKTAVLVEQLSAFARASMYPTLYPPDVLDARLPKVTAATTAEVERLVRKAAKERDGFRQESAAADSATEAFLAKFGPDVLLRDLSGHAPHIVQRTDLFEAGERRRTDPEFHDPAFQGLAARITSGSKTLSLRDVVESAVSGKTPAADDYTSEDEGGQVVVKVATLTNMGLSWPSAEFALASGGDPTEAAPLKEGDVLFTSSAHAPQHICRKVDVVRGIPPEVGDRARHVGELIRLRPIADGMPPEVLAGFLRSSVGGEQVRRCVRGITSHVYPEDLLANVLVPVPPESVQQEVLKRTERANRHRWEYHRLVREAVKLLDDEFGVVLTPGGLSS